jgi:hypothetical protein
MSLGLWKTSSLSSALVDSALAGTHEDAWSSVTSVSLLPKAEPAMKMTIQTAATIHLVTGLVSLPAICLCMGSSEADPSDSRHRGLPRDRRAVAGS